MNKWILNFILFESHRIFFFFIHRYFNPCSKPYPNRMSWSCSYPGLLEIWPSSYLAVAFMSSNASFPLQCPHSEICRIRVQILLAFASPECHWLQGGCKILAKSRNWPRIFSDSLMLLFIWCYHQALLACSMMHFTFKLHKGYLLCWCYIVCKKDAHMEMKKHQLPSGFPAFSIHFPKQPRDYFSFEKKKKSRNENPISWHLCMAFWSLTHQVCCENGWNKKALYCSKL